MTMSLFRRLLAVEILMNKTNGRLEEPKNALDAQAADIWILWIDIEILKLRSRNYLETRKHLFTAFRDKLKIHS